MDNKGVDAYTATMTLGERIEALRKERGWSQTELARRSGLNNQTVHRIEHGAIQGGWQSRVKLARAFGIPVAALDGQAAEETKEPSDETNRASIALASLTEHQILDGIAAFVRELERRQGSHVPPHQSTRPNPPDKQTARPRRNR